jgi:hypothetical protein
MRSRWILGIVATVISVAAAGEEKKLDLLFPAETPPLQNSATLCLVPSVDRRFYQEQSVSRTPEGFHFFVNTDSAQNEDSIPAFLDGKPGERYEVKCVIPKTSFGNCAALGGVAHVRLTALPATQTFKIDRVEQRKEALELSAAGGAFLQDTCADSSFGEAKLQTGYTWTYFHPADDTTMLDVTVRDITGNEVMGEYDLTSLQQASDRDGFVTYAEHLKHRLVVAYKAPTTTVGDQLGKALPAVLKISRPKVFD